MAEDEDEYDPAFPTGDDDDETILIENVPKLCTDDVPLMVSDEVVVDTVAIPMKIEEVSTDQEPIEETAPRLEIAQEQIVQTENETFPAQLSPYVEQTVIAIDDVTIDADGSNSQDVIAEEVLVTTEEEPEPVTKFEGKALEEPSEIGTNQDFTSDSNCSSETWKTGETSMSPSPKDEEDSNSSPNKKSLTPVKVKRSRGRPAGSTKAQHTNNARGESQEDGKNGGKQTRRRSSRIKSIEERKERQRVLEVKKKCDWEDKKKEKMAADPLRKDEERKETSTPNMAAEDGVFQPPCAPANGSTSPRVGKESPASEETFSRPEKVKSRWRRSSEMERAETKPAVAGLVNGVDGDGIEASDMEKLRINSTVKNEESEKDEERVKFPVTPDKMPTFDEITANIYLCDRKKSKSKKEVRRMICDCTIMKEEISRGMVACGEDCLNRLLMIECGSRCPTAEYCSNKRFQRQIYAKIEPFKTEMKGWGLRALEDLPGGSFIIEYVGEVLESREFRKRVKEYARDNHQHYYFMALKSDEIIDATRMGNQSRFINHSCSPNCETQKWTVNGELRIGFFTRKYVAAGEELTFDYQFQRYGKEAQRCFCQSDMCRGWIGGSNKQMPIKKEKQQREQIPRRKKYYYEERRKESLEDMALEEEVERLNQKGGLRNREHTLTLSRLMVRAEDPELRMTLLKILQKTTEQACLRLFLDYHGLSLLWSWMMDVSNDDEAVELKTQILQTLEILPINNKTILIDSKVFSVVQKWAELSQQDEKEANYAEEPVEESPKAKEDVEEKVEVKMEVMEEEGEKEAVKDEKEVVKDEKEVVKDENEVVEVKRELEEAMEVENVKNEVVEEWSGSDVTEEIVMIEEEEEKMEVDVEPVAETVVETVEVGDGVAEEVVGEEKVVEVAKKDESVVVEEVKMEVEEKKEVEETVKVDEEVKKEIEKVEDVAKEVEKVDEEVKEVVTVKVEEAVVEETSVEVVVRKEPEEPVVAAVPTGLQRIMILANLARKLLEAWSSLKEAYRIPKREQNQTRREHEREADRKSKEKDYDRDRDRDDDDRSDYDRYDRRRSPDRDHYRHREKRSYHDSDSVPEHKFKKRIRSVVMPSPGYSPMARMTKEERRHLFELKVQQQEAEEALRKQQEEYLRQQQEAADAEAAAAIEVEALQALSADPMLGMFYNQEYPPPPEFFTAQPAIAYGPPPAPVPVPVPVPPPVNCEPPVPGEEDLSPILDENGVPYEQPVPCPPPGVVYPPQTQPAYSPANGPPPGFGPIPPYLGPESQLPSMYYPMVPPGEEMDSPGRPPSTIIQIPISEELWQEENVVDEEKLDGEVDDGDDNDEDNEENDEDDDDEEDDDEDDDEDEDDDDDDTVVPQYAVPEKLPPNWKSAKDTAGRTYYYNRDLRQPQWEPPTWDNVEEDEDGDMGTPTIDEPKVMKKRSTTTAAADTSSEHAKKLKEHFRTKMSLFVVQCLNPYQKRDCKLGRITSKDDFKHLARKLTHFVLAKELKHCRKIEELEINDNVKHKAKDFVKKYMGKFGPVYRKNASPKDDGV